MAQIFDVSLGGFRPLSTTDLAGMGGGAGSGADRELVVTTYRVKTAFSGASVGDTITATQVIDVSAAPTTVSTIWRNQTTAADLGSAPLAANLEIVGAQGLTDAQLRASAVPVSGPLTDAQLRASAVAVSGPLTDAQLRAESLPVVPGNITAKFREAFESYAPGVGGKWVESKGSGDLVFVDGNALAASYLVVSKSPLNPNTVTEIETTARFGMPIELAVGLSMSQRTLGQEVAVEIVSDEEVTPVPDVSIASISQSGTTLTINTTLPHGLVVGKRIGTKDVPDSRLNYPALVVASTPSPNQITATAGPGGTIPSVTAGPINAGTVFFRSALGYSENGTSIIFENTTATNASVYVRSESGDALPSGTAAGNHAITVGTTASVQAVNAALTYAFQPTTEYRCTLMADRLQWTDGGVDTVSQFAHRLTRTQVVPDPAALYKLRIRATNNDSLTVPTAQIVSVAKTGTTTATIIFDRPHNLTTADLVVAYGVRDQTNFANLTAATAVASVVNPTTITAVWGAAVTATSYGGYAAKVQGGNLMSSLGQGVVVCQSAALAGGVLTLVGNTNWSGLLIGDLCDGIGIRNAVDGATLGVDGAYRVRNIVTTTLELERVDGGAMPANFTTTNCGGTVIKRTDMRISFVRIFDFERERVEILPRPSGDVAGALSVAVAGTAVKAASAAAVVADASLVVALSPNSFAPIQVADVTSSAITSTTTTAGFTPTGGVSYEVNIPVTAVSGTTPTMDVRIEESDDGGTNWFSVYDFPRITATGMYRSPKLPLTGNRVRYVQTLGGTTPSFTRAVNRVQCYDEMPVLRQLIDRALVPNTLNSTTPSLNVQQCRNVQLVVNIGAATTPHATQLEGSDDNGATWYAIGSPLTAVASSTVQLTVANVQAGLVRARVSTAGASVTAGHTTIKGF